MSKMGKYFLISEVTGCFKTGIAVKKIGEDGSVNVVKKAEHGFVSRIVF